MDGEQHRCQRSCQRITQSRYHQPEETDDQAMEEQSGAMKTCGLLSPHHAICPQAQCEEGPVEMSREAPEGKFREVLPQKAAGTVVGLQELVVSNQKNVVPYEIVAQGWEEHDQGQ
jgi:hypothetical protein